MAAACSARRLTRGELERRIARTQQHVAACRAELHRAMCTVAAAERALLARRAEREEIAVRLAQLVDVLESLEAALAAEHTAEHTMVRPGPREVR